MSKKSGRFWSIFWFVLSVLAAAGVWFFPGPMGQLISGLFAGIAITEILVTAFFQNVTFGDLAKLIMKLGGKKVLYLLLVNSVASALVFTGVLDNNSLSPMLLFTIGLWLMFSLELILTATPIALHWEEWSKEGTAEINDRTELN
ncbi:MAG: hypothetical protein HYV90_01545 [Candidatus Woesebacteria bacterium]|nr:MAG: hypothetical protein HYV90_01545 [Candidatus Woesebacteria bacterium]